MKAGRTAGGTAAARRSQPPSSIPLPADKPKAAAKPAVQKSYALLSDIHNAGIKERLKLSPAQEQHWPGVESALRAIARKIHATRQASPNAAGAPIDAKPLPDASSYAFKNTRLIMRRRALAFLGA